MQNLLKSEANLQTIKFNFINCQPTTSDLVQLSAVNAKYINLCDRRENKILAKSYFG